MSGSACRPWRALWCVLTPVSFRFGKPAVFIFHIKFSVIPQGGAEIPIRQGIPLDGLIAQVYLKVRIETIRSTCARSSLPGIIFS